MSRTSLRLTCSRKVLILQRPSRMRTSMSMTAALAPPWRRPQEGAYAGGDAGEEVGLGGADHAHGGAGAVLFVVGVDHQEQRQGGHGGRQGFVVAVGHREHHVQEVAAVGKVGVRVHERQAQGFAVAEGGDGAHLADELGHGQGEVVHALDFEQFRVVVAQGVDDGREDGHGLAAGGEAVEMVEQALVEQFMVREQAAEGGPFLGRGQLAEDEQHGGLDERAAFERAVRWGCRDSARCPFSPSTKVMEDWQEPVLA